MARTNGPTPAELARRLWFFPELEAFARAAPAADAEALDYDPPDLDYDTAYAAARGRPAPGGRVGAAGDRR